MEAYARSRTRSRATATKTTTNTFSGDNFKKQKPPLFPPSHDAVYAGASKCGTTALAPRPEDYSEIFGGFRSSSSSRACSIPVLDLPAVSDINSVTSVFDYSEIFAGFHGVDFAVPYDELFQPFDAAADGCSSDDAWTPVGTESLSDDSDPFASSEKSQCFSHEDSHQPLDSKKFTVSYHKVNSGASSCIPNTTHVEAVHGYTCVVDETTSPREMETEKGRSFVADDIVFSMDSSSPTLQKHKSTTMSGNSFDAGSVDTDHTCERPCYGAASMPHANSKYAFVSGTNLQIESQLPPPSGPLSVLTEQKGDIKRSCTGLKASNGYASKVAVDSKLPPCFDMEVNVNSSAAVSAAAMKDAMDKAQAKLKAAKVLLDRKKDGQQLIMRTDVNGSDNITLVLDCADGNNRVQTACESGPSGVNSFVKDGHVTFTSQSLPGYVLVEQPKVITRKTTEGKHGKQCSLSKDTVCSVEDGEWKEATCYNDKSRLAALAPSNDGGHVSVCKRHNDDSDERSSNSAEEACLPEGNRRKLKATNAVSRQEYHDRLMRVAQQVHESDICAHAKTDPRLTGFSQEDNRDHRANLGYEPEKNVSTIDPGQSTEGKSLSEATEIEATKGRPMNIPGKEEFKQKETDDHRKGWNDGVMYAPQQSRIKEFPERKEERRMGEAYERVECEDRLQENIAKQRKQSKHDVVRQKKENERREMNGSNSIELFKDDLGGEEIQTVCGNLEKGKAKELEKVEDKKSKEAFAHVPVVESTQRTCYVHGSDKKKDSLERQENGNYFRVTDDCRGSESILEDDILLECHSKCEETSTREIRMRRLSKCLQFSSGDKADQDLKQDNNEEKLERVTEQKTNDKKSMQVSEMEEAVIIQEKSCHAENEEAVSSAKDEWDDEDHGSERSSEVDLPVENGHLKPSDGANLCENTAEVYPDSLTSGSIKPQAEATGFPDVSAWEKNVEDSDVASDEESTLGDAETAVGLDGDKPVDATDAQMAAVDNEHERVVHRQDSSNVNNIRSKSGGICGNTGPRFRDENKVAQSVADPKLVTDSNIEQGGRRIFDENHTPFGQDEKVKSTLTDGNNGRNEDTRDREAACSETLQKKEFAHRRSQLPNNTQNSEQKGTSNDHNCSNEVKTMGIERNLEEEQLRKLEEEREREREREKDRMAVEIAIREARQRAYADARDRAEKSVFERATDEARQKAMAEARERLEKACAEARERSLADKTSEARLRAERAAVERATAEARQRAFEKAMAERATLEARERMQRSISEKFTSERDVIMRQSSMPTMHNVKSEAPDGEPAQRCRARLERHRRTVERVAKALAEKNMRDLVAQREQAERSRLAETLDADIKRWSSGKEGNLRALLSTLQYILAPDSGWQPIPLTEVITAAAVKKAYRKATLCVHPDKLQQRGATIQQKYICEKVFDLLKDAWNKFNSEEK